MMTGFKTGRLALLGAALTLAVPVTMISDTAQAWKPTTHVYFAERAIDDAKDGKVTINSVDYETGNVTGTVGTYSVDRSILAAIRAYPSHYRAGVLGPDAYPDILSGQQSIHPDEKVPMSKAARTRGCSICGTGAIRSVRLRLSRQCSSG